jgi:hypothetical protein
MNGRIVRGRASTPRIRAVSKSHRDTRGDRYAERPTSGQRAAPTPPTQKGERPGFQDLSPIVPITILF